MTQSADPKRTLPLWLTAIIAGVCVGLIAIHALAPGVQIDAITIALILLPFIIHFIPSFVEFEGFGVHVRRSEIDKAIDKTLDAVESSAAAKEQLPERVPGAEGDKAWPSVDDIIQERISATRIEQTLGYVKEFVESANEELVSIASSKPVFVPIKLRNILDEELDQLISDYLGLLRRINPTFYLDDQMMIELANRTGAQLAEFALGRGIMREKEYEAVLSVYQLLNEAVHSGTPLDSRQALRLIDVGVDALTIVMTKRGYLNPDIVRG